jgi:hypothetical protein
MDYGNANPLGGQFVKYLGRFNDYLAVKITDLVGTMWCAYLFSCLALVSFPSAVHQGISTLISWIAQTFLQLVLLSIIIVGQKIESATSDARAAKTYEDAENILREVTQIRDFLLKNNQS